MLGKTNKEPGSWDRMTNTDGGNTTVSRALNPYRRSGSLPESRERSPRQREQHLQSLRGQVQGSVCDTRSQLAEAQAVRKDEGAATPQP